MSLLSSIKKGVSKVASAVKSVVTAPAKAVSSASSNIVNYVAPKPVVPINRYPSATGSPSAPAGVATAGGGGGGGGATKTTTPSFGMGSGQLSGTGLIKNGPGGAGGGSGSSGGGSSSGGGLPQRTNIEVAGSVMKINPIGQSTSVQMLPTSGNARSVSSQQVATQQTQNRAAISGRTSAYAGTFTGADGTIYDKVTGEKTKKPKTAWEKTKTFLYGTEDPLAQTSDANQLLMRAVKPAVQFGGAVALKGAELAARTAGFFAGQGTKPMFTGAADKFRDWSGGLAVRSANNLGVGVDIPDTVDASTLADNRKPPEPGPGDTSDEVQQDMRIRYEERVALNNNINPPEGGYLDISTLGVEVPAGVDTDTSTPFVPTFDNDGYVVDAAGNQVTVTAEGGTQYVREAGTNEIYDISEGKLRHITEDEANRAGIWDKVSEVDAGTLAGIVGTTAATDEEGAKPQTDFERINAQYKQLQDAAGVPQVVAEIQATTNQRNAAYDIIQSTIDSINADPNISSAMKARRAEWILNSSDEARTYRLATERLQALGTLLTQTNTQISNQISMLQPYLQAEYGYHEPAAPEKLDTEVVEANGQRMLINSQTGETIRVLGASEVDPFGSALGISSMGGTYGMDSGQAGNLAQRNNNPGNLKDVRTGQFRSFPTIEDGFAALKEDIKIKISGRSRSGLTPNNTLLDFFKVYAPASDNNNPAQYAAFVASKLGVLPTTKLGALGGKVDQMAQAIATQEGFYNSGGGGGTLATDSGSNVGALPGALKTAVRTDKNGQQYIDLSRFATEAQKAQVQAIATTYGVPAWESKLDATTAAKFNAADQLIEQVDKLQAQFMKSYRTTVANIVAPGADEWTALARGIAENLAMINSRGGISDATAESFMSQIVSPTNILMPGNGGRDGAIAYLEQQKAKAIQMVQDIKPGYVPKYKATSTSTRDKYGY